MVRFGGFLCLIFAAVVSAQSMPVSDEEADLRDDALIRSVLEGHVSIDDIYASPQMQQFVARQADEVAAASQRRIARAEKRVEEARGKLQGGVDPNKTLDPLFTDLQNRIRTGYEVLDRANILKEIVQGAQRESRRRGGKGSSMVRYDGNRRFSGADLRIVSTAFETRFHKHLPISADGQTSLHAALGFDHRGRIDVALSPDQTEGLWLCNYLRTLRIPYYAFRKAVPGSATSAHIHIGPGSTRLHSAPSD